MDELIIENPPRIENLRMFSLKKNLRTWWVKSSVADPDNYCPDPTF
jgi:hypothetical protein